MCDSEFIPDKLDYLAVKVFRMPWFDGLIDTFCDQMFEELIYKMVLKGT